MADVPNVPAGNEERPIIGGGAADQTGEEERGRGRRGRGVTATPATCQSCNRTFDTQAGLAIHRRRASACNPANQPARISAISVLTVATVWFLYALYGITRGISYGLLGIYFFSNCTPVKFHSSLAVLVFGIFETFGLSPLYRASARYNRFSRWFREAYRSFLQI
ncbi:hypothetical protein INT47_007337 [Mucor saturninus]|uniref:C2H2-type domain-containing protein n=1 Tax=Mucor saturninus TaxID=64648 RepID=A0A8H7RAT2_9FUNG|nr:hypothetical protein INT47_007337 [Mucor saturninus]